MKKDIYNFTKEKLSSFFEKSYTAKQIFMWVYKENEENFDNYTNISKPSREKLKKDYYFSHLKLLEEQNSSSASKFLFFLTDGNVIETVLMHHEYGNSICVSTQVGCNMGCMFCESGKRKKVRNLTTSEMVLQILSVIKIKKIDISSVVVMGIGEPFDNYDNLIDFLNIINDSDGLNIGSRKITVSNVGIVPRIYDFADIDINVNLAISLHFTKDDVRSKYMPINKIHSTSSLMSALKYYQNKKDRRISIEYVMLKGINDNKTHALELVKMLEGLNVYVNLIQYNETGCGEFKASSKSDLILFYKTLKENNIDVTIRKSIGNEIMAACGQLRSKNENTLLN